MSKNVKNVIMIGNTDFSKLMTYYINEFSDALVEVYSVDKEYIKENTFNGKEVVAFEEIEKLYPPEKYDVYIGIGYRNMSNVKAKKIEKCKAKGYKIIGFTHPTAIIDCEFIGEGNTFLEGVIISGQSKIGNNNFFWNGTNVSHNADIGSNNFFTPSSTLAGNVNVKNNCLFGSNCTVKNGVNIADYTLIGAGAYVSDDTEPYSVIVPSRSIVLKHRKSTEFI